MIWQASHSWSHHISDVVVGAWYERRGDKLCAVPAALPDAARMHCVTKPTRPTTEAQRDVLHHRGSIDKFEKLMTNVESIISW